jgi:hypothetical protein
MVITQNLCLFLRFADMALNGPLVPWLNWCFRFRAVHIYPDLVPTPTPYLARIYSSVVDLFPRLHLRFVSGMASEVHCLSVG